MFHYNVLHIWIYSKLILKLIACLYFLDMKTSSLDMCVRVLKLWHACGLLLLLLLLLLVVVVVVTVFSLSFFSRDYPPFNPGLSLCHPLSAQRHGCVHPYEHV
jgi:hypothetical protein